MSTSWGLHCVDCDAYTGEHGGWHWHSHVLPRLVYLAPLIRALTEAHRAGYEVLEVRPFYDWYGCGDDNEEHLIEFLANHADHAIELQNEYGAREPLPPMPRLVVSVSEIPVGEKNQAMDE